jgi:hypothetical protein
MIVRLGPFIPPVGEPILPRLRHSDTGFDWTFAGRYQPIFVDSGTTALRLAVEVALRYCGHQGPTWVPAYGCPDILSACLAAGSKPVLYDVAVDSPFFAVGQSPPPGLVAAVAAHFLGLVHPAQDLQTLARDAGAVLIEDSAQRFPMAGDELFGDAVVLSFGRGKPVSLMEGGCLLLSAHLYPLGIEIASSYRRQDVGFKGRIKRTLHDVAIRPEVFGLIRRMPGLHVGDVMFKHAPSPCVLGPGLKGLASRAAIAYQSDRSWIARQRWTETFASNHFPELQALVPRLGQSGRRLLRMPLLAPDAETAKEVCCRAVNLGVGVTRLYGAAQPYITAAPSGLCGAWRRAIRLSEAVVTLPILSVDVV